MSRTIKSETITPSRACDLLGLDATELLGLSKADLEKYLGQHKRFANNYRNRTWSHAQDILKALQADINRLVKDGTPIRIESGRLKDGQHRLLAILLLGMPVEVFVQYVDDGDSWWGDMGRKRTAGDYVRHELGGELEHHTKHVAVGKMVAALTTGKYSDFKKSTADSAKLVDTLREWGEEIGWAVHNVCDRWPGNPKPMASGGAATCAAFAIARRYYPDTAESLLNQCKAAKNSQDGDPATALRRFIFRNAGPGAESKALIFAGVASAVHAARVGKRCSLIRSGGTVKEIGDAMAQLGATVKQ